MSNATIDRIEILEEATALEQAGGQWKSRHVAAVVGLAQKTVLDTAWLRRIALPAGDGSYSWDPKTVRAQQLLEAQRRRRRLRPTGS